MKRMLMVAGFTMLGLILWGQGPVADSLRTLLKTENQVKARADALWNLSFELQDSKPDSSLLLGQQAYFLAKDAGYLQAEAASLGQMATAYKNMGNFPKSLENYIAQLKIEESIKSPKLGVVYLGMASLCDNSGDLDQSLHYAKKADSIFNKNNQLQYTPYSLLDIGDVFEKKNMLDSAIMYTNRCLTISIKTGNTLLIGTALNNLGNIYSKYGNHPEALKKYYAGIPYELSSSNYSTYAENLLGMARVFEKTARMDSAAWFGKKSFEIAAGNGFTVKALNASVFLTGLYKREGNIDSAFAYQEIMVRLKDSIESAEKVKELQNISSAEQLRQAELEQLKLEQIKDREEKLQLLFIGIMIPLFFLASIVISRRKVHKKLIEFTGIVSVLLFFEYITLLLHPFIAEKTHHSPLIEIVIFVAIAAIITPTHHRIQHWLIARLTAFNYLKHHHPETEGQKKITEEGSDESQPASVTD